MRRLMIVVLALEALVSLGMAQVKVEKVNYHGWKNTKLLISPLYPPLYLTTSKPSYQP